MKTDDFVARTEQAVREIISSQHLDERERAGKEEALLDLEFESIESPSSVCHGDLPRQKKVTTV